MRVKRQKRHRKVVRFYSACFGFHKPFKVLCDGTFVHHLLAHGLIPADDALERILGGSPKLFTTRCAIAELAAIRKSHADALAAAHLLLTARCDHENRVSAVACIESVIGDANPEHFFVATQDADLRRKFRQVPGVPVIYGLRNSLFIEQPSVHQKEFVKSTEEKRLHMSDSEYQKLYKRRSNSRSMTQEASLSSTHDDSGGELVEKQVACSISPRKSVLGVAAKSTFKRNRAKGPNPLSCKKKKSKDNPLGVQNQDKGTAGVTTRKRIRKRKRAQEGSSRVELDS